MKTRDYNVLLSFYPYLQDNLCLQDNDSYPLSNLILNQIQKNEFDWNFVSHTRRDSGTINTDLGVCKKRRKRGDKKNPRGGQTQKTLRGGHYKKEPKKKTRTEGGEIEKRRRRAFSSRCLHRYLCLRLHQVKSSSLCFCVIVARK